MPSPDRPLRILMVMSQYWPYVGGAERQTERLARELIRRGHTVEVLTKPHPNRPRREERDGVRIRRDLRALPLGKMWGLSYMLSAFAQLWRRRRLFDVFHLHQLYLHAASASLVRRLGGPPVIVKIVNSGLFADWLVLRRMKGGALWLRWAKRCDRVIAICRQLEPELREEGFAPQQIVRIPNGVDDAVFRPDLAVAAEPDRLLFMGRLDPYKGLFDLLKAVEILRARRTSVRLHIIGEGDLRDPLEAEIARRGLGGIVTLRSFVEDVALEYARAAVVVLPSTAEGMSNVMLEAMACARPVVATRVGGADDLLAADEGESLPTLSEDSYHVARAGILTQAERPAALAAAIERVLDDAPLARRLGEAARRVVEESFSIRSVADRYETLYRELTAESARERARTS